MFDLNPVTFFGNLGYKAGSVVASNLLGGQKPFESLGTVLSKPASPIIINQAPKTGLDALGIGFVEKNLIIIGVLAVAGLYVYGRATR